MTERKLPPVDYLRQRLRYDPETGSFTWLRSEIMAGKWNSKFADKAAFRTFRHDGYLCGSIDGRSYLAHRVAWAFHTGEWPDQEIDHINGNKADNRFVNLRAVSHGENMQNMSLARNNKTGITGVQKMPSGNYSAQIRIARKTVHIGTFDSIAKAAAARRNAEIQHGFHANHGRPAQAVKRDTG